MAVPPRLPAGQPGGRLCLAVLQHTYTGCAVSSCRLVCRSLDVAVGWLSPQSKACRYRCVVCNMQRSLAALEALWAEGYFRQAPQHRLAFREFGATLGLQVRPQLSPLRPSCTIRKVLA
jgi:hypothetical protein